MLMRLRHLAAPQGVINHEHPPWTETGQHLFVVEPTVFLVGVDEAQVKRGFPGQGGEGGGGRSQAQRHAIRQARLAPVGLGNTGPILVHVQAEQPPPGTHATGQAEGRIAREGAHLNGVPGAHHPRQPLHEHPLLRSNLHPGHRPQRLGGGNQGPLHLVRATPVVQDVAVKIRTQEKGLGLNRGLGRWCLRHRCCGGTTLSQPRRRSGHLQGLGHGSLGFALGFQMFCQEVTDGCASIHWNSPCAQAGVKNPKPRS